MAEQDRLIGTNVARLRGSVPQQELADRMRARGFKWGQATVWAVEKGERQLKLAEALALADALDTSVESFARPTEEMQLVESSQLFARTLQAAQDKVQVAVHEHHRVQELARFGMGLIDRGLTTLEWTDPTAKSSVSEARRQIETMLRKRSADLVEVEATSEKAGEPSSEEPEDLAPEERAAMKAIMEMGGNLGDDRAL